MANEEYCKQLERRIAELEKENAELRAQLGLSGTKAVATVQLAEVENSPTATVNKYSSPNEKIQLFRSLFRGREDVFAKRWYATTNLQQTQGCLYRRGTGWLFGITLGMRTKPNRFTG